MDIHFREYNCLSHLDGHLNSPTASDAAEPGGTIRLTRVASTVINGKHYLLVYPLYILQANIVFCNCYLYTPDVIHRQTLDTKPKTDPALQHNNVHHEKPQQHTEKHTTMAESEIKDAVAKDLSSTPFACSSLTQLSGGTANFLYRGVLSQPLSDGTSTIIVKHAEDYLASNADFKLSAERCVCRYLPRLFNKR